MLEMVEAVEVETEDDDKDGLPDVGDNTDVDATAVGMVPPIAVRTGDESFPLIFIVAVIVGVLAVGAGGTW